jgi:hypothetical protein
MEALADQAMMYQEQGPSLPGCGRGERSGRSSTCSALSSWASPPVAGGRPCAALIVSRLLSRLRVPRIAIIYAKIDGHRLSAAIV